MGTQLGAHRQARSGADRHEEAGGHAGSSQRARACAAPVPARARAPRRGASASGPAHTRAQPHSSFTGSNASQGWEKPAGSRAAGSRIAARMRSYSSHTAWVGGRALQG